MADPPLPPLTIRPVSWPEIAAGDDLVALLVETADLHDGDVAVVTSKVVSKAEGSVVRADRPGTVAAQTVRVLARRGDSVIAETHHGLVMAAAGVDGSNTPVGTVVLLPVDPDASARRLREGIYALTGRNVAVLVTDTVGRAWRNGQTDLAIGCAGMAAWHELRGVRDPYGNTLTVTAPALADEVASAADLVKGKMTGCPVAVVTGLAQLVYPPGQHGSGTAALIRSSDLDLFGLGAREAVVAATLRTDAQALAHFPPLVEIDPSPFDDLTSERDAVRMHVAADHDGAADVRRWQVNVQVRDDADDTDQRHAGALGERARALAVAHRLTVLEEFGEADGADAGWHTAEGFVAIAP